MSTAHIWTYFSFWCLTYNSNNHNSSFLCGSNDVLHTISKDTKDTLKHIEVQISNILHFFLPPLGFLSHCMCMQQIWKFEGKKLIV